MGTGNTVDRQSDRRLEALNRLSGERPVATVNRSRRKAQAAEPSLKRAHLGRACGLLIAAARDQEITAAVAGAHR
jgi:hypothetical protein